MSSKKTVDLLKAVLDIAKKSGGFDHVLKNVSWNWISLIEQSEVHITLYVPIPFDKVQVTGGDVGRCIAEFVVRPEDVNQMGGLHGGFTATLVDCTTTYALITKDCHPGVTVDLHVRLVE